jgi:hypothetical protein
MIAAQRAGYIEIARIMVDVPILDRDANLVNEDVKVHF